MAYWSGLKASIKELKIVLANETDPRRISRIEAEIAEKKLVLASRQSNSP